MRHFRSKFMCVLSIFTVLVIGSSSTSALADQSDDKAHQKALKKAGWRSVWSDEFDSNTINTANWSHEKNCQGGGNN